MRVVCSRTNQIFTKEQCYAFCSIHHSNGVDESIEIPDVMFDTARLRQRTFYDEILLGLTRQPLQQVDAAVTQGVCVQFQRNVRNSTELLRERAKKSCVVDFFYCTVEPLLVPWFEPIRFGFGCDKHSAWQRPCHSSVQRLY